MIAKKGQEGGSNWIVVGLVIGITVFAIWMFAVPDKVWAGVNDAKASECQKRIDLDLDDKIIDDKCPCDHAISAAELYALKSNTLCRFEAKSMEGKEDNVYFFLQGDEKSCRQSLVDLAKTTGSVCETANTLEKAMDIVPRKDKSEYLIVQGINHACALKIFALRDEKKELFSTSCITTVSACQKKFLEYSDCQ